MTKSALCGTLVLVVLLVPVAGARGTDGAVRASSEHNLTTIRVAQTLQPAPVARAVASWCGTPSQPDSTPNALAGYPVHWVYAIPSDGTDRFATFASSMQTDAEAIDAWWRGQDSTRVPREDLAQFACGLQLDLSTVRLSRSSAALQALDSPFDEIWSFLTSNGFSSQFYKYVVYYDGPVSNDSHCGSGGTLPDSLGIAMVFVQACAGVPNSAVAAHELIHTLGAVPDGAPHDCPAPNGGHTCDDTRDILFPFSNGSPLADLILDPGRDDYYGHSGTWADAQDSPWLVQLDRQTELSVAISGPGSIGADVPGLQCTQSCTTTWNADTKLQLTVAPSTNAKLVRWGGACSGASACLVSVSQSTSVTALFAPLTYRLTVAVSGKGTVRDPGAVVSCPSRCSARASSYAPLRLSAKPAKGWRFKLWKGACHGTRPSCTLPMTKDTSARAVFARR